MFGAMQGLGKSGPGLVRQTSFGNVADSQFKQGGNLDQQQQQQGQNPQQQGGGIFGQTVQQGGLQVPGQVTHTPSFGNLSQTHQVQNSPFGQSPNPQGILGAQTAAQPQNMFPTTQAQQFNNIQSQPQSQPQPQPLPTMLDMNIK